MSDYTSSIKSIAAPPSRVYAKLEDLSGLNALAANLSDELRQKATIEPIDSDRCAFTVSGAGRIVLKVVEREPEKTIKFVTEDAPLDLTLWIQLLPDAESGTRLRLTLRAELNFFIRKMIGPKLEEAVEQLAEVLRRIPY